MAEWKCVLELDESRSAVAGSETELADAIRNGADLHIGTEFRHNEHIDTTSDCPELIREVADFRCTVLLDNRWTAAFMTLRQPVLLPDGFGPRPSMSLFLYNQNGQQAIARLYLDGPPAQAPVGQGPVDYYPDMPRYHQQDAWDSDTNAPSSNFIYDFDLYRYLVNDKWQQVLAHDADGTVVSGSIDALGDAFSQGCDVKVGIRGLYADLAAEPDAGPDHEVFIQCGPGYYYTERKLFLAETQPLVRAAPAIPLSYRSQNWDCGWAVPRTDGFVARLFYDPYTLDYRRTQSRHAIRWFVC